MSQIARGCAAVGLVVCLQAMTWACSARSPATVPPVPQADDQPHTATATAITPAPSDECALTTDPGEPIATIGLTDRIDPSNALHPTNASERLLFNQLFETLVRVDCMGRVQPGLATSWRLDQTSGLWIVTLRENARFADGAPVTATDVRAIWTRNAGGQSPTYATPLVQRVDVLDDRTLAIQLNVRGLDAPAALSHPGLAVARPVTDSPWPLGTRSNRVEPQGAAARGIAPSELIVTRADRPPLRFLVAPRDARDLLDAGVDLLLTRDPATLGYAATLPDFQRLPLPWQRTYIFFTAGRSLLSPSLSPEARQALADDAVRGEARGALGPPWWEAAECYPLSVTGSRPHIATRRIVYDAADDVARDLAERLVALAGASGASSASALLDVLLPDRPPRIFERATGLSGEALTQARREGTDAGYIAALDSRPLDSCSGQHALLGNVQWLHPRSIVALVDTRLQAVVRRGRSGLTTVFDGSVLIDGTDGSGSR